MSQRIWNKALKGHSAAIDLKELEDFPLKIAEAPLVFKSKKPGSIVVVINVTDSENQPVVVAINTSAKGINRESINQVTSIHGRPLNQLELWKEQGLELHNSAQKETFILSSKRHGAIPGLGQNKGFKDATNVPQKSEPAKSLAEKMSDLTKKNAVALRSKTGQQSKSAQHSAGIFR
jgi:hypothetical protein